MGDYIPLPMSEAQIMEEIKEIEPELKALKVFNKLKEFIKNDNTMYG